MVNVSSHSALNGVLEQLTAASYQCFDRVVLFGHLMGLARAGGLRNIYRMATSGWQSGWKAFLSALTAGITVS